MTVSYGRFAFRTAVLSIVLAGASRSDELSGLNFGGNFGRARNSYDTGSIDSQIYAEAQSADSSAAFMRRDIRKMSDVWWADVGYFITPSIGFDAAFIHLGEIKYGATGILAGPTSSQSLESTNEAISHGPALALIFRLPLTEFLAIDLRAGDYYGKTTLDSALSVGSNLFFQASTKSSSSLLAGVGASYSVGGHYSFHVNYLHVHHAGDEATVGVYNVNLATAGVSFFF